jgi:hypothetical protein
LPATQFCPSSVFERFRESRLGTARPIGVHCGFPLVTASLIWSHTMITSRPASGSNLGATLPRQFSAFGGYSISTMTPRRSMQLSIWTSDFVRLCVGCLGGVLREVSIRSKPLFERLLASKYPLPEHELLPAELSERSVVF